MASSGPKSSFLLAFQITSPALNHEMMRSVGICVAEIVSTIDQSHSIQYTYIHLKVKAREEEIKQAVQTLTSTCGLQEYNTDGHSFITSNNFIYGSQNIEDHPGFRMLVKHEESENPTFKRWPDETNSPKGTYGYKRLKNKLSSKGAINKTTKGIYVLRVDNRSRPFFYVGKAENIEKRIEQHQNGTGAYCITGESFTRVNPITQGTSFEFSLVIQN